MLKRSHVSALIFGLLALAVASPESAFSQEFPYLAPAAPEFDSGGNVVKGSPVQRPSNSNFSYAGPSEKPSRYPSFHQPPKTSVPSDTPRVRTEPREAPRAPTYGPRTRPATPVAAYRGPSQAAVPGPTPPVASYQAPMQGQIPAQMQQRTDCTEYVQRIAGARSQEEMQMAAKYYLGCLMQNGWDENTAKRQVISVIETAFTYTR